MEANNGKLTVVDVLKIVVKDLEKISIPVSMIDSIGTPIKQEIANLNVCISSIEQEIARRTKETEQQNTEQEGENGRETDAE